MLKVNFNNPLEIIMTETIQVALLTQTARLAESALLPMDAVKVLELRRQTASIMRLLAAAET